MAVQLNPAAPAPSILYRYLTEGFSLPSEARLEYLANMAGAVQAACEEMAEAGEAQPPLPDISGLEAAVAEARANRLDELQAEYTRLFVSGMPTTPCRLVEAVHREGVLVGEATEEAASMYLRFGLEVKDREPDHLTAELEFLAYLTGTPVAEGTETERYRRARIKFVNEHLLKWVPGLTPKVRRETPSRLYAALASLLDWLLTAEATLKV